MPDVARLGLACITICLVVRVRAGAGIAAWHPSAGPPHPLGVRRDYRLSKIDPMSIVIDSQMTNKIKKQAGRPRTGMKPMIGFRSSAAFTKRIDAWAKKQEDNPTRGEAIRRLITYALDRKEAEDC